VPGPGIDGDWLVFSPRIEVISPVEESCLGEIVRNILQHVLTMQLCKNDDSGVILIDLVNLIKFRPVISPVAQLVELVK